MERTFQITPFLHVPDMEVALAFFRDALGFELKYRESDYAYVEFSGCGLRLLGEPARQLNVDGKARVTVYIDVADVDALHARLAPKLATLPPDRVEALQDMPYGQREFQVRLPDGDWLNFGAPIRPAATPADDYEISFDSGRFDVEAVHDFLSNSYWAAGIPLAVVRKAIENSLSVAAFAGTRQVGFARVVTDRATFAYLADVYVLEQHRSRGLSRRLVAALLDHPELQGLRRLMLVTRDAHGLYERFGFTALAHAERVMELHRPDVYAAAP